MGQPKKRQKVVSMGGFRTGEQNIGNSNKHEYPREFSGVSSFTGSIWGRGGGRSHDERRSKMIVQCMLPASGHQKRTKATRQKFHELFGRPGRQLSIVFRVRGAVLQQRGQVGRRGVFRDISLVGPLGHDLELRALRQSPNHGVD